jgi:hypothetical protein
LLNSVWIPYARCEASAKLDLGVATLETSFPVICLRQMFFSQDVEVPLTVIPPFQPLRAMGNAIFPLKVFPVMVAGPVCGERPLKDQAFAPMAIPRLSNFDPMMPFFCDSHTSIATRVWAIVNHVDCPKGSVR